MSVAPLDERLVRMADVGMSTPLIRGQNQKFTRLEFVDVICAVNESIYSPPSSNTIREAGDPSEMPFAVPTVKVRGYAVLAAAAVTFDGM